MARSFTCIACGRTEESSSQLNLCWPCNAKHRRDAAAASSVVGKAVHAGQMLPARMHACSDCGRPASHYDHRDYTKPLLVDPVCPICNAKRGRAFNSFLRPIPGIPAPPAHAAGSSSPWARTLGPPA